MPKAYWIALVTVTDPEAYKGYQAIAPAAFNKYGGRFIVRGGSSVTVEGDEWQRHVVIEFDSMDLATACYHSPEYQEARAHRDAAATASIVIVEGMAS